MGIVFESVYDEAIHWFEVGFGRKLTPVEREIFKAGFNAGYKKA